jgi:hypothetical protein
LVFFFEARNNNFEVANRVLVLLDIRVHGCVGVLLGPRVDVVDDCVLEDFDPFILLFQFGLQPTHGFQSLFIPFVFAVLRKEHLVQLPQFFHLEFSVENPFVQSFDL